MLNGFEKRRIITGILIFIATYVFCMRLQLGNYWISGKIWQYYAILSSKIRVEVVLKINHAKQTTLREQNQVHIRYVDLLLLFSLLSDDRSKASSKTIPPHGAIQSLLFQMRVSSPVLKVIQ